MPRHSETKHLPYTPEQLFDLVADVARYDEFLPWVVAVRVRSSSADGNDRRPRRRLQRLQGALHQPRREGAAGPHLRRLCRRAAQVSAQRVEVRAGAGRRHELSLSRSISPSSRGSSRRLPGRCSTARLRRMIGAFEAARGRALRHQQFERAERRLKPDPGAAFGSSKNFWSAMILAGSLPRSARAKTTVPTGFAGVPPPGPAIPVIATAMSASDACKRAAGHRPGRRDADRAERLDDFLADVKIGDLGRVGISDVARFEHVRRAGDLGDGGADEPAGAAFRHGYALAGRAIGLDDLRPCRPARREGGTRSSRPIPRRMLATAWAAMPSRRPVKPRPSVVVAFTLTCSSCKASISAIRVADR